MSEQIRIRWGDSGSPTGPCIIDYNGYRIVVRHQQIEEAQGNPAAIFTATRFEPQNGPPRYMLGAVEIPID